MANLMTLPLKHGSFVLYIEKMLLQKFPQNSFVISFCIQFGKYRNINIRICQDLDDSILDGNLEMYDQPVMQIHLKT